uniref:C3H1-type domain-containing protein n=1 Tax=Electrophorus electricus TaxID=8005 RepID=A0AAY5EMW1_ELEEL
CVLGLDNYPTEFVEYVDWSDDDDEYPRQNNRYCGFAPHFLNSGFPKPLPGLPCFKTTKRITPEVSLEAAKNAKELIDEEEKLKKKSEKKKQKKMVLMNERFAFVLSIESLGVNPFLFICFFCFVYTCEAYDENNATCVFQELDLNSCFVTNAAAIAKRKLKQKPTFERKDKKAENAKQQTGQQKSAVQPHNKVCKINQGVMGNAYADSGNFNMAVKYFTEAIKHNPKEFFGNRSFCYERMQQYEKALTDAVVAVQLNSTFIKGLFRKGKALVGLKRYNEACLTYKEILKLNSSCTEAAQELMLAQIMWLMDMGFSREQSSNALIIHGTVEKALEALSGMEGKATPAYTQRKILNLIKSHSEQSLRTSLDPALWSRHHLRKNLLNLICSCMYKIILSVCTWALRCICLCSPTRGLFPIWVGNLVPGITNSMITELFRRCVSFLSLCFCAFLRTCLVVRYPDRIHPHLGVSTTASTNTGKECQFWRTAGCIKNNRCSYRHVPEHKGIDQPKAK